MDLSPFLLRLAGVMCYALIVAFIELAYDAT